jgi:hypothetical protein
LIQPENCIAASFAYCNNAARANKLRASSAEMSMAQDVPETAQNNQTPAAVSATAAASPPAQELLNIIKNYLNRPATILVLLLLSTMMMLKDSWNSPFYHADDDSCIYLCVEGPGDLPPEFQHEVDMLSIHFVTTMSYRLDYALFGKPRVGAEIPLTLEQRVRIVASRRYPKPNDEWAPAVRIMNGLYHTAAGFILWFFFRRIGAGLFVSAFAAVLWTSHPMALESVSWIAERKNVLCALFGFASLLAWTADRSTWWRWPLVTLLFLLALLSKASALGLLPLFFALEVIDPMHRSFSLRSRASWLKLAQHLAVPVFLAAAITAISVRGFSNEIVKPPGGTPWTAILTDFQICSRYIWNLHFPSNLSFFYAVDPIVSVTDGRLWGYAAFLVAYAGAILWLSDKYFRLALIGLIWFVVVTAPHWNLIAIRYPMQDRYIYIGMAGLLLSSGIALRGAHEKLFARTLGASNIIAAIASAWLIMNFLFLAQRAKTYESDELLMLEAVKRQPRSGMARYCASEIYQEYYQRHASFGPKPDPKLEQIFLAATLEQYHAAEQCHDYQNFFEVFHLKVLIAELLMRQNRLNEARKTLDGWLPPQHMIMVAPNKMPARGTSNLYSSRTLSHAWLVIAEVCNRESFIKELSAEVRMEKCKEAISATDKAVAADIFEHKPHLVKARSLFRLAEIEHQNDASEMAKEHLNAARTLLLNVPVKSESAAVAQLLLKKMTLPEKK